MHASDRRIIWVAIDLAALGVLVMWARGSFNLASWLLGALLAVPVSVLSYHLGWRTRQAEVKAVIEPFLKRED